MLSSTVYIHEDMARKITFLSLAEENYDEELAEQTWKFLSSGPLEAGTATFEQLFAACTVTLGTFSAEDLQAAYNEISLGIPRSKVVTWPDFRLFMTAHGNKDGVQRIHYVARAEGTSRLAGSTTLVQMLHQFRRMREAHGVLQAASTRKLQKGPAVQKSGAFEWSRNNRRVSSPHETPQLAPRAQTPQTGSPKSKDPASPTSATRRPPTRSQSQIPVTSQTSSNGVMTRQLSSDGMSRQSSGGGISRQASSGIMSRTSTLDSTLPAHQEKGLSGGTQLPGSFHRLLQVTTGADSAAVLAAAVVVAAELPESIPGPNPATGLFHRMSFSGPGQIHSGPPKLTTMTSMLRNTASGSNPDFHQTIMQRMGLDMKSLAISRRARDLDSIESPRGRDMRTLDHEDIQDLVSKSGYTSGIIVDGQAIKAHVLPRGKVRKNVSFSTCNPEIVEPYGVWSTLVDSAPTSHYAINTTMTHSDRTTYSSKRSSGSSSQDSRGVASDNRTADAVSSALLYMASTSTTFEKQHYHQSTVCSPLPAVLSLRQLLSHPSATPEECQEEDCEKSKSVGAQVSTSVQQQQQRDSSPRPHPPHHQQGLHPSPRSSTPTFAVPHSPAAKLSASNLALHDFNPQHATTPHHPSTPHSVTASHHAAPADDPVYTISDGPSSLDHPSFTRLPNALASFTNRNPDMLLPLRAASSNGIATPHVRRNGHSQSGTGAGEPRQQRASHSAIPDCLPSMLGPDPHINPHAYTPSPPSHPRPHEHQHQHTDSTHHLPYSPHLASSSAAPTAMSRPVSSTSIPLLLPTIGPLSPKGGEFRRHTYTTVPLIRSVPSSGSRSSSRCASPSLSHVPSPPFPFAVKFRDPRGHLLQGQHGGDGVGPIKTHPTNLAMLSHSEVMRFRHSSPLGLDRFLPPQVVSNRRRNTDNEGSPKFN